MSSLDEVFAVAERANIPAEVWHLKTAYKANWGRMAEVLRRFPRRTGARSRRHRQHVSVRSRVERPRRLPAALGPRGRARSDDRPPQRSRVARSHQARHGRSKRQGLGEPVVWIRRRRRRDDLDGARSLPEQMGRQEPRRDRQGDGQGSARCGDGSRDRRSRRDLGHHLDHARRRRADGAGEPDDLDRHRFRGAGGGWAVLRIEVAPARVGIVHARPRQVRARREADDAGGARSGGSPRGRRRGSASPIAAS